MFIGLGVIIIICLLFNPQLEGLDGQPPEQPNGQPPKQPNGQPPEQPLPPQTVINTNVQQYINEYKGKSEQFKNWYRNLPATTQSDIQRIANEWIQIIETPKR